MCSDYKEIGRREKAKSAFWFIGSSCIMKKDRDPNPEVLNFLNYRTMKEEMKNIGEIFKQRRKELNLSLKEVENATSIRMSYLQSIEDGEVQKLISPVYAQGFLRQYALFIGIDGDKIIKENPQIFSRAIPQEFSYGIGTLEVRGNPGAGVKWFPNAIWVFITMGILVLAWFAAKYAEVI